jgi:hypothetical protein
MEMQAIYGERALIATIVDVHQKAISGDRILL